ncbi:TonB-dependent receptor plug domain-containing protein [bacterium]|nr:TonB-dependent receptor plug domain-containing protein [bacterium]
MWQEQEKRVRSGDQPGVDLTRTKRTGPRFGNFLFSARKQQHASEKGGMMRRIGWLLTLLALTVSTSFAGTPIRGFVIDKQSGEPLPVANVTVEGMQRGSSTNLDGFFAIPNMDPGTYTLKVSYLGYHGIEYDVEVTKDVMEPIRIELLPASVALEEVVYTVKESDEEADRVSPKVSTVKMDAANIRMVPAFAGETDVLRVVQQIPGVKSSSDISSALYVRGGSSDMTLLQMDQSTVYNPSHLFGLFSTFNADAVKHLDLMKGGFPAKYGGRSGSVLEVITNDGNRNETKGNVNIGVVSAKGAIEGPLPNEMGSYAFSGRRTYFDPLLTALRNSSDDFSDLPNYYFYDLNGKVNYDITDRTTLTVGAYRGRDILDAEFGPEDSRITLDTYWGNTTYHTRLRHVLPRNAFFTLGAAYSQYRSGLESYNEDELFFEFRNRFNDLALRADFEYYGMEKHVIETGVETHVYDVNTRQRDSEVTYVSIDTTNVNVAHYIQDKWRINGRWEILPGLRTYYHEDGDRIEFDPRMAAVFYWNDNTRLKLAGGRYHQFVYAIATGGGFTFFDIWVPFDGSVDPMYSDQIVFGWEHDPTDEWNLTFEAYYNDLHNVLNFNTQIDRGQSVQDAFIQGEGYAYGFEWMARKKAGKITGWLGYSLSWTKRRFADSYFNDGAWYYPKWDRRHDFMAVGTYQLSKSWDVSAAWRYNTGQGFSRIKGVFWDDGGYPLIDPDENLSNGGIVQEYGSVNNYRYPADHRLDITFTYKHKFFGNDARLNFSIYNAYSRRALWFRDYEILKEVNNGESEYKMDESDIKLLPILPLFSYEVRF